MSQSSNKICFTTEAKVALSKILFKLPVLYSSNTTVKLTQKPEGYEDQGYRDEYD